MTLRIQLSQTYLPALLANGMNKAVLAVKPFPLKANDFTVSLDGLKPKHVEASRQVEDYTNACNNFSSAWCFCIASQPNDRAAKYAAAYIMQRAVQARLKRPPKWYDLYGGFDNNMIGPNAPRPGFLVLSNIVPESTAAKFEKLRDTLEYHSDIPRVVVTTGVDPFTFMTKFLHYPVTGCLQLTTSLCRAEVEI